MKKSMMPVPPAAATPDANCVSVDVAALAVGEDGKQGVAPQVGDSVDFTATGKVTSVANGQAQITLESVNGQPVESGGEDESEKDQEPDEDDMAAMEQALRGKAATADDENNYV